MTQPFCGTLFADALARAQSVVDALWRDPPHPPHLLHGDLGPANVIAAGRSLAPIDFQDMIVGFDIQDLAISISALRGQPHPHRLIDGFRAGYVQAHPWPMPYPATGAAGDTRPTDRPGDQRNTRALSRENSCLNS